MRTIRVSCPTCEGTGTVSCPNCEGSGRIYYNKTYEAGNSDGWVNFVHCSRCNGTGLIRCPDCNGSGTALKFDDD